MGCLGSVPGVPQAPDLNEAIDMEAVGESIVDAVKAIPENIEKNKREFPGELRNCEEKEWDVPDTTMKLKKEATPQEIDEAAIVSACGTAVKDAIKDSIWGQIEGKVDEVLAEVEPALPDKIKNGAKDKFKEKTIDPLVDAAVDKCLDAAKDAMANGDKEEEQGLKNNEEKDVEKVESNPTDENDGNYENKEDKI
eukprot:186245_1